MKGSPARRVQSVLLASLLGAGVISAASAQNVRYCEIAFEFSIEGKALAAPSTIVEFGQPADIVIDKPDMTGSWQFHIVADAPTLMHRVTTIPIEIEISEITAGQTVLRAAPHFGAVPGQRADLQMIFGDDDGRSAHIGLVANPRSDADAHALIDSERSATPSDPGEPR
jgi:hypothetical protein